MTADRLDPQYIDGPYLNILGRANFAAGQYEDAIEVYRRNKARNGPVRSATFVTWAASCLGVGRIEEAKEIVAEVLRYFPDFSMARYIERDGGLGKADPVQLIKRLCDFGLPE